MSLCSSSGGPYPGDLTLESLAGYCGTLDGKVAKVFLVQGRRTSFIGGATPEDVSDVPGLTGELVPQPSGTEVMEMLSTSASDKSSGTGAAIVRVWYLDTNFLLKTSDVTLNGTTPVLLSTVRAFSIVLLEVVMLGTSGSAVGAIKLRDSSDTAKVFEAILAGNNRSFGGRFTVPADSKAFITDVTAHVVGVDGGTGSTAVWFDFQLLAQLQSNLNGPCTWSPALLDQMSMYCAAGTHIRRLPMLGVPPRGRIFARAVRGTSNVNQKISISYLVTLQKI